MKKLALCFSLLCAALAASSTASQEPVGAVVAWHRDLPGTPALPSGWAELDGQVASDPTSPFHNLRLPDLNGTTPGVDGRFLRGDVVAGGLEDDAIQGHHHDSLGAGTDGSTLAICPAVMDFGFTPLYLEPASATVGPPNVSWGMGTPRVAQETRPVNMSVVWILKTGPGPLPVGSILAWHPDLSPLLAVEFPPGWVRCDGGTLEDPLSPYHGQVIPNLNATGRFLRGGPTSGVFQTDAFQDHSHAVSHDMVRLSSVATNRRLDVAGGGAIARTSQASPGVRGPKTSPAHGAVRTADETRPANMSVVWILKTRVGAPLPPGVIVSWYDEPAAALPSPGASWPACDGRTILSPRSPLRGVVLPDLNGSRRFLRGGMLSGIFQDDAFQGHAHEFATDAVQANFTSTPGPSGIFGCGNEFDRGMLSIQGVIGARVASETRPLSMHAPWLIYIPRDIGPSALPTSGSPTSEL